MKQSAKYDARAYAERGLGTEVWKADGKPDADVKGRMLDPAGWPTGKMMDGSDEDTGATAAAPDFANGGEVWVTLSSETDTRVLDFNAKAKRYWLALGEQPDQNWVLSQNGTEIRRGNGSSEEGDPFSLAEGPAQINISFNGAAVSKATLDERKAATPFQGVAKTHYKLHPVS